MATYRINIPDPCNEKWEEMKPTACGAFCNSCQKEVIDFTTKNYSEIARIIHQSNGPICGRINTKQLLVEYEYMPVIVNNNWFRKGVMGAGLTLLLASSQTNAQTSVLPIISENIELASIDNNLRDVIDEPIDSTIITVTGTVMEFYTEEIIPFAIIKMIGEDTISVATDEFGKYKLEIPYKSLGYNPTVQVFSLGYKTVRKIINVNFKAQTLNFLMENSNMVISGGISFGTKGDHAKYQADRFYFNMK